MPQLINSIMLDMIDYYKSDPKRIQHFIKVHSFSKLICEEENADAEVQFITETAALVHDIGIREAEKRCKSSSGKYQEELGPDLAEKLLQKYSINHKNLKRILYLVGHHHTYSSIDGLDYQVLIEADFLVNMLEDEMSEDSIRAAYKNIFKTSAGKKICRKMYENCFKGDRLLQLKNIRCLNNISQSNIRMQSDKQL